MLDEILKSIRSQLYERAASPLIGSIVISWALWNYRFILLILSGVSITEKYRIIDEVLFSTWQQIYLNGLLYPLITSLLYIYAYPYPAKYVFEFSRNKQKEIANIKRQIEGEALLTVKESRAIRHEIYTLEEELQKDLERKDSEIERLKLEIAEVSKEKYVTPVEEQLDKSEQSLSVSSVELPSGQLKMLQLVGEDTGEAEEEWLISRSKDNHVIAKFNLGELQEKDYLACNYDQGIGDYIYELTHKGRSYLVANGHV